jgi:hypothetical protein
MDIMCLLMFLQNFTNNAENSYLFKLNKLYYEMSTIFPEVYLKKKDLPITLREWN